MLSRLQYAAAAKSLQSCPTLCDLIDGSPPGSPITGILQARTLEWVAISFSNAWKWKVKVKSLSRVWLLATPWTAAYQAPPSMGFSGQQYWSGVPLPSPKLYWGPQKTKNRVAIWCSNPTPGHIFRQNCNSKRYMHPYVQRGTVHNYKLWKQSKCPSFGEWIKKRWFHWGNQGWKRHMYPNVHRSTVYNSQDMEAT